jgi:YegS/Rv2252/BmrU family lipid kinase
MNAADDRAAGPYAGRTFIILNPEAGHEDAARLRRRIGAAFAEAGAAFDLVTTAHAGHGAQLAREAAALGYRAVAVCGGDGTLAEAATGLAGSAVPLAIIPRGTGNQVAQNLGIPLGLRPAIDVVIRGRAVGIDLGRTGERSFMLVAGAGFDAAVMRRATRELKERWGFGAYIYAMVKESLSAAPQRFRVTADGRATEVDAVSILVANVGELFARWLPLRVPLADRPMNAWNDGVLEVLIVAKCNPQDIAALVWHAAKRRLSDSDRIVHFQAREITIDADPPSAVQIDGDPYGSTPISMAVVHEAMRVIVPR